MRVIILGTGSKGNSTLLIGNNKKILIDVGFSYPKMVKDLSEYNVSPSDIDAILVTHTHSDHIKGLNTFVKKNHIPVYTNTKMMSELKKVVNEEDMVLAEDEFDIGDFLISTIHTSHDAPGSRGFLINNGNTSLVYVTDTGYLNKKYLDKIVNKNVYIFESNHDINMLMTGPYPYILKQRVLSDKGHLSNETAGIYLNKLIGNDTKRVILAHLSEINNTEDLAIETVQKLTNNKINIEVSLQNEIFDVGEI